MDGEEFFNLFGYDIKLVERHLLSLNPNKKKIYIEFYILELNKELEKLEKEIHIYSEHLRRVYDHIEQEPLSNSDGGLYNYAIRNEENIFIREQKREELTTLLKYIDTQINIAKGEIELGSLTNVDIIGPSNASGLFEVKEGKIKILGKKTDFYQLLCRVGLKHGIQGSTAVMNHFKNEFKNKFHQDVNWGSMNTSICGEINKEKCNNDKLLKHPQFQELYNFFYGNDN